MLLGFGRGAHALEGAVDAALRGKAVAWPLPAAQAEVVRRLAERLRASEAAVEAAEQRHRESEGGQRGQHQKNAGQSDAGAVGAQKHQQATQRAGRAASG